MLTMRNFIRTSFKSLAVGDTFDFIHPSSVYVSFSQRCEKVSARKYRSLDTGTEYRIGAVSCEVYNVKKVGE